MQQQNQAAQLNDHLLTVSVTAAGEVVELLLVQHPCQAASPVGVASVRERNKPISEWATTVHSTESAVLSRRTILNNSGHE
jgi:hypothetical protein